MEMEPRAAPVRESLLRRHAGWLLVALAYLYVFPYYERLNNPNENARVWMTRAIVEHHVLNIDQLSREWGYVNDKATNGVHVYSGKAPGVSFLGVPVLMVHTGLRHLMHWGSPSKRQTTLWLRIFAVELPMCVFLYFFARYIERVTGSPTARDLLVVALGCGTLLYPYGVIFVGHALAAAAAFSSYMLSSLEGADPPRPSDVSWPSRTRQSEARQNVLAWAGLLAGVAVIFEYQAVLVAAALAGYTLVRHRRRSLAFFVGSLPAIALLGLYHTVLFGRPWRFPFGSVENPEYLRTAHSAGFHGLSLPKLSAIGSSLFSSDYGLFVFSPVLAIGAVCAIVAVARGPRREGIVILVIAVVMLLFLGGMSNWRAGWCVGPRYIATVAPFLIAAIAHSWPTIRSNLVLSAITAGLAVPSVLLNSVSGAVYPHYPPQFNDPVFDLAFPLLGQGYSPYSFGMLLGLPGSWSLFPLAVALVLALSLSTGGEGTRPARWSLHSLLVVVFAALFLLPLSRYGRQPSAAETQATALVHSLWEPAPEIIRPPPPSHRR
jgi:hypothetical protein